MRDELERLIGSAGEDPAVEHVPDADAVGIYLAQAARVPLLTAAEERDLFVRIEAAQQAHDRARALHGSPSARPVRAAAAELQALKNRVVEANLRLVVSLARRQRYSTVPLLDRIQDGNIGLIEAVDRYDYHLGFRFSTYAVWWIRRSIYRGIALTGRTIRLPSHLRTAIVRIDAARTQLKRELGREPAAGEIAARAGMTVGKVAACLAAWQVPLDLDAPVAEGTPFGMLLPDERSVTPEAELLHEETGRWLGRLMLALTPRERRILEWRFGLEERPPETLETVAGRLGLSRERVRQIEKRALERLRRRSVARAA